jgi:telomerase Cajal body protein 1
MSCISFNPDASKAYAVGSYANSVGIYVEDMDGCALEIRDLNIGGVSCVRWSPCGRMIWVGGRNCDVISCWDVRKTQKEVGRVHRELRSNQKLSFDIDPWGKYLATGNKHGELLIYEASSFALKYHYSESDQGSIDVKSHESLMRNKFDCLNTVAFHPYSSLIFTGSGQRHFDYNQQPFDLDSENDSDSEDPGQNDESSTSTAKHKHYSSSIQVWRAETEKLKYSAPMEA